MNLGMKELQERYKMIQLHKNICSLRQSSVVIKHAEPNQDGFHRHSQCQLPKLIPDMVNIRNIKNPNP